MIIKTRFKKITGSREVGEIFRSILNAESEIDRNKEHFWVMGLSVSNTILYIELATLGIVSSTVIAPREVYRQAIMKGVSRIIVCHNHPSAKPQPSDIDNETTKVLKQSGEIIGIDLLDHIIISNNDYYSYAESIWIK